MAENIMMWIDIRGQGCPMRFGNNGKSFHCTITYDDKDFVGFAYCHDDDMDFVSERTGYYIAEGRTLIKILKYIKKNEILPLVKSYKHLTSCMESSKNYNPKSYEAKMVRRELQRLNDDLATVNNRIADEEKSLKDYIAGKEKIFQRLRAKSQ